MKKINSSTIDLTSSPIMYSLLLFTVPIIISTIFQQLYNAADSIIVGNFLGEGALAAIGSTAAIYELIVGFALGIGNGMSIVTARFYGIKNFEMLKKATAQSILIGLVISIIIMFVGHFSIYTLLQALNTPSDIIQNAYEYIYVIMIFVIVTFTFNLGTGLLRSVGNSIAPLVILVISSVVNVVLDIIFISQFNMGISGAAYATVISQFVSAVGCILYLYFKVPILIPKREDFKLDKELLKELFLQGLSMGFMSSIVSIGSVILQIAVNQFGTIIIAAQVTARRIQSFFIIPISSLTTALTTFISQNYGAQKWNRIHQSLRYSIIISILWGALVAILMFFTADQFVTLISGSTNPVLIENARHYLFISTPLFGILGILLCLRNSLQGIGRKLEPLISSCIELAGKFLFLLFIVPFLGYLGIMICEPIIWVLMTIQLAYSFYKKPLQI